MSDTEDIKGRAKEAAGAVTGDESMKREGQAQQQKADAEKRAAEKEAEASAARAEAVAGEAAQRSEQ
jgi:uncharacterized protein YjbJ (UPF0337 family)